MSFILVCSAHVVFEADDPEEDETEAGVVPDKTGRRLRFLKHPVSRSAGKEEPNRTGTAKCLKSHENKALTVMWLLFSPVFVTFFMKVF